MEDQVDGYSERRTSSRVTVAIIDDDRAFVLAGSWRRPEGASASSRRSVKGPRSRSRFRGRRAAAAAKGWVPGGRTGEILWWKFECRRAMANAEFTLAVVERRPVENNATDCLISRCAIRHSPEPAGVFRER